VSEPRFQLLWRLALLGILVRSHTGRHVGWSEMLQPSQNFFNEANRFEWRICV
jgi:hypothetical protein